MPALITAKRLKPVTHAGPTICAHPAIAKEMPEESKKVFVPKRVRLATLVKPILIAEEMPALAPMPRIMRR